MFKRITIAALASTAILSLAALSPASAQHRGPGGMHIGGGGFHHGGGGFRPGGFHPGGFRPGGHHPGIFRPGGRHPGIFHPGGHHPGGHHPGGFHPGGHHPGGFRPGGHHHHHWNWWRWRIHHRHHRFWWRPYRQVIVTPGYSTSYVAPVYSTPVATCPSNCLKKQYLEDGSVLFTDQCTNESATAPAATRG